VQIQILHPQKPGLHLLFTNMKLSPNAGIDKSKKLIAIYLEPELIIQKN